MAEANVSYELTSINFPPTHNTLGVDGSVGEFESFTDPVPTTFYAVKCAAETHAGTIPYFAASIFGSCSCPTPPAGGAARGWR